MIMKVICQGSRICSSKLLEGMLGRFLRKIFIRIARLERMSCLIRDINIVLVSIISKSLFSEGINCLIKRLIRKILQMKLKFMCRKVIIFFLF